MTSVSGTTSPDTNRGLHDPSDLEAVVVGDLAHLTTRMKAIGAEKLLYGETPLARIIGEQSKRGALPPAAARETLTRQAIRRKEERRRAQRSGNSGFLRAVRSAGGGTC